MRRKRMATAEELAKLAKLQQADDASPVVGTLGGYREFWRRASRNAVPETMVQALAWQSFENKLLRRDNEFFSEQLELLQRRVTALEVELLQLTSSTSFAVAGATRALQTVNQVRLQLELQELGVARLFTWPRASGRGSS